MHLSTSQIYDSRFLRSITDGNIAPLNYLSKEPILVVKSLTEIANKIIPKNFLKI